MASCCGKLLTREIGIEIIRDASTGSNNGSSSSLPGTGAEQQADYITTKSKIHASDEPDRRPQLIKTIEPLAFFELEPCLPYPFCTQTGTLFWPLIRTKKMRT